ncbi:MAG: hypothetical protein LBD75_00890 [Candidatus Peribacteria bacterium]|jgi:hypothetical protein|nr:hypothetical protein [Candidatus Peribacteria bacterium]
MTKQLALLLDLLNIEEREPLLAIGELIAHQTKRKLIIHHRLGFIFEARYALLLEKIPLEEFLAIGDSSSSRALWKPEVKSSLEMLGNVKALAQLEQKSMLLLDEISFLTLSKAEQDEVQKVLEKKEILLLLC